MTQAEIQTGASTSYHVLKQIDDRHFEDIRKYRLYQLALLESLGEDFLFKDIDFILKEDSEYDFSGDFHMVDDEEWKRDQLRRASEKIVAELEAYNTLLYLIEPPETEFSGNGERKEHELSDEDGRTKFDELYDSLRRDLRIVNAGFGKLPEQTDLEYTEPFRDIDSYGVF